MTNNKGKLIGTLIGGIIAVELAKPLIRNIRSIDQPMKKKKSKKEKDLESKLKRMLSL